MRSALHAQVINRALPLRLFREHVITQHSESIKVKAESTPGSFYSLPISHVSTVPQPSLPTHFNINSCIYFLYPTCLAVHSLLHLTAIAKMDKRYTARNPFVHDYNPLTHLRQYNAQQPLAAEPTSAAVFRRPAEAPGFSPTKRLAKSLPRTMYSDPLTGRVIDFSNPSSFSTFSTTAAMALYPRMPPVQRIDPSPILAKTRVRSQVSDPITGVSYSVNFDRTVSSLGRPEVLSPTKAPRQLASSPTKSILEASESVAGSRKKKPDHLAYVNPYYL